MKLEDEEKMFFKILNTINNKKVYLPLMFWETDLKILIYQLKILLMKVKIRISQVLNIIQILEGKLLKETAQLLEE